jgi:hypothetical protein
MSSISVTTTHHYPGYIEVKPGISGPVFRVPCSCGHESKWTTSQQRAERAWAAHVPPVRMVPR